MDSSFTLPFVKPPSPKSSAIPIVAPSNSNSLTNEAKSKNSSSKPRQCKNVIIYGYCKYEGKGCEFSHEKQETSPDQKNKVKVTSPAFSPTVVPNPNTTLLQNDNSKSRIDMTASPVYSGNQNRTFNYTESPLSQKSIHSNSSFRFQSPAPSPYSEMDLTSNFSNLHLKDQRSMMVSPLSSHLYSPHRTPVSNPSNMFYQQNSFQSYNFNGPSPTKHTGPPPAHHFYVPPLPHVSNLTPYQRAVHSFFINEELRKELIDRNHAILQQPSLDSNLPSDVHGYHSLVRLDLQKLKSPSMLDYPTHVYKCISAADGKSYVLKRIEGFVSNFEPSSSIIEQWSRIRHANIISFRESFFTNAFNDSSLILVYDYHPLALPISSKHFNVQVNPMTKNQNIGVSEKVLWSYITQIASAIKTIHASGLSVQTIDPNKILVTAKNRLRINHCGLFDILGYSNSQNVGQNQQKDLIQFGRLILSLACNSLHAMNHLTKSIDFVTRHYSPDLKNTILYLLSEPNALKNIDDVVTMVGPRILNEINSAHTYNDFLENELSRELENSRLVRLMAKIGFINERPEFEIDPEWAETGDRYMVKLFRDYVFHQVDEKGTPVLDLSHVISCLNKLDAGIDERILLISRDEQSCLIVSYRELKLSIETAYQDLLKRRI